jgi:hypothetical protein
MRSYASMHRCDPCLESKQSRSVTVAGRAPSYPEHARSGATSGLGIASPHAFPSDAHHTADATMDLRRGQKATERFHRVGFGYSDSCFDRPHMSRRHTDLMPSVHAVCDRRQTLTCVLRRRQLSSAAAQRSPHRYYPSRTHTHTILLRISTRCLTSDTVAPS